MTETNDESELPGVPAMPEIMALPDRADAPVSEITERFFKAIVAKVPIDRIEELHLFSPLRSGGVETGIAVVAARVPAAVPVPVLLPEEQFEHELEAEVAEALDAAEDVESVAGDGVVSEDGVGDEAMDDVMDDDVMDDDVMDDDVMDDDVVIEEMVSEGAQDDAPPAEPAPIVAQDDEPDPYAPDELHEIVEDAIEASVEYVAEETPAVAVERHTVYTARYRLVQKGPERGKWESDVVDEADAPLITVEMVVRGVQRRAGEASETTRYTGAQIARALRLG